MRICLKNSSVNNYDLRGRKWASFFSLSPNLSFSQCDIMSETSPFSMGGQRGPKRARGWLIYDHMCDLLMYQRWRAEEFRNKNGKQFRKKNMDASLTLHSVNAIRSINRIRRYKPGNNTDRKCKARRMVKSQNKTDFWLFVCLFLKQMQVSGYVPSETETASAISPHRLNPIMSDRPLQIIKLMYRENPPTASS